jgi:hypothetical protein
VHGVADHLPEQGEEQVAQWLQKMDELIPQHAKQHPGLAKVLKVNAEYVRKERMKFLRADEYDPVKAAERMGFYFDMKQEFFCHDDHECACLGRDLTVNDLTTDDIMFWRTGFYQVCREKDRAGRIVCIVFLPACYKLKIPPESMVRVYMVMNTILTQNVEVQRTGNVHIAYAVGLGEDSTKFIGSDHFANSVVRAGRWAPLRGVAKHFCYDHESLHPMFAKYAKPMAAFNAVRFRSHFGTNAEVMFNLMSFGISTASLPVSDEGVVDTAFHNSFINSLLQQQQSRDEQRKVAMQRIALGAELPGLTPMSKTEKRLVMNSEDKYQVFARNPVPMEPLKSWEDSNVFEDTNIANRVPQICSDDNDPFDALLDGRNGIGVLIYALNQTDVILGRGLHNKNNPGNLRLKLLLEKQYEAYNNPSLNRAQKTAIVNSIVKQMEDAGSRFVYPADDDTVCLANDAHSGSSYRGWLVASDERIRDKITHDFRNMKRAAISSTKTMLQKERASTSHSLGDGGTLPQFVSTPSPMSSSDQEGFFLPTVLTVPRDVTHGIIFNLSDMDILLGRNKRKGNIGNKLLKDVLEEYYDEYEAANQSRGVTANAGKMVIVRKVLARMEARGVRFLVQNHGGNWSLAPPEKVYDKMTQDFRNIRWAKKNRNPQVNVVRK